MKKEAVQDARTITRALRAYLKRERVSHTELAEEIGVSRALVSYHLTARGALPAWFLLRIQSALSDRLTAQSFVEKISPYTQKPLVK